MAMGELLTSTPPPIFLLPKYRLKSFTRERSFNAYRMSPPPSASTIDSFHLKSSVLAQAYYSQKKFCWGINAPVTSSSKTHATIRAASAEEDSETLTDTGGDSGGDAFGGGSGNGGDSGGGNRGDENDNSGKEEDEGMGKSNKTPMSMSQKLTLGYAVLVGAGGVIGYLKSGSQTSIISGILSASLLYFVCTLLPTKPVIASALGFVLSFALLGVMGSRFKNSGKIFPAGIVSFMSLIMTGGYLHGFMRGAH